jgi:phosphoenolpyruvate carboxylase
VVCRDVLPNVQTIKDVVPPNTSTAARMSYVPKTVQSAVSGNLQQTNTVQTRAVDTLMAVEGVAEQEGKASLCYESFWSRSFGQERKEVLHATGVKNLDTV